MSDAKTKSAGLNIQPAATPLDLIPQDAQTVLDRLERFQHQSDKSWNVIASDLGVSSSIISQIRRGSYGGRIDVYIKKIERYLTVEDQKKLAFSPDLEFVEIKNNISCINVFNTAMIDGILACVTGDTGTSKTSSIKQFMKDHDCIYIHANKTYRWPVEYLRRIHSDKLVGKDGRGSMNQLAIDIIRELTNKNILIIIDQADYLNLTTIDVLRTIQEDAHIGMVFVGLPSFLSTIRGTAAEVRQVRDRIKIRIELKRFREGECKEILDLNFPDANGFSKDFYLLSNGSIRILSSLIYNVKKMIKSGKYSLDQKTIYDAAKLLERSVI